MTLKETVARRLPSLAAALMVYRYLREQQRRYARAGRDTRPLRELVYEDAWEQPAPWAEDPPGTRFTKG